MSELKSVFLSTCYVQRFFHLNFDVFDGFIGEFKGFCGLWFCSLCSRDIPLNVFNFCWILVDISCTFSLSSLSEVLLLYHYFISSQHGKKRATFSFVSVFPRFRDMFCSLRSQGFLKILAVPKSTAFCKRSTLTFVPISSKCFPSAFRMVPCAQTTTGTTFSFTCQILQSSLTIFVLTILQIWLIYLIFTLQARQQPISSECFPNALGMVPSAPTTTMVRVLCSPCTPLSFDGSHLREELDCKKVFLKNPDD